MISRLLRLCLVAGVALMAWRTALLASEPTKEESAIPARLLGAIEKSDYAAFTAEGDARFKTLPKEKFDATAERFAPGLRGGYEIVYLGDLRKQGYRVTLWKIVFKDGSNDLLATLTIKDGKIAGFVMN